MNFKPIHYTLIAISIATFLAYALWGIVNTQMEQRNALIVIGVAGALSVIRIILTRQTISVKEFYLSIQLAPMLSLLLLIFVALPIRVKAIFAAVAVVQYLIATNYYRKS